MSFSFPPPVSQGIRICDVLSSLNPDTTRQNETLIASVGPSRDRSSSKHRKGKRLKDIRERLRQYRERIHTVFGASSLSDTEPCRHLVAQGRHGVQDLKR